MQERYLGDSHDYAKYALLCHLGRATGCQIGVNWYLTYPDKVDKAGNNDGEKRHHVTSRIWRGWDADLLRKLDFLQTVKDRNLARIEELGILPQGTRYYSNPVPDTNRSNWYATAREFLNPAEIVFLDPDNGFEVSSATRRTQPKYTLYSEALDFLNDGKIVVAIQFARQCSPVERALSVRKRLSHFAGRNIKTPVVPARLAPNLLFVTLAPQEREEEMLHALTAFANGREKIELID